MDRDNQSKIALVLTSLILGISARDVRAAQTLVDDTDVNDVLAAAKAGDMIIFKSGTYSDVKIMFKPAQNGTQTDPITFKAQKLFGVTFTGSSTITIQGDWLIVDGFRWEGVRAGSVVTITASHNCVFSNNTLKDAGPDPTATTGSVKLQQGSTHNLVTRNRFDDLPAQGVQVRCWQSDCSSTHNTLSYNHWLNKKAALGNNGESIQIGQQQSTTPLHTVVEFNLLEKIAPSAELISNKTSSNIFRHNTFREIDDALVLRGGQDVKVHDNWFFDTKGIRVHESGHDLFNNYLEGSRNTNDTAIQLSSGGPTCSHLPVKNVRVAHNTIVDPAAQGIYLGSGHNYTHDGCTWTVPPTDIVVVNNVIVNTTGKAIYDRASTNTQFSDNVVWASGGGSPGYTGTGVIQADPKLIRKDGLYRLQQTSSALIGKGGPVAGVLEDIFGRPRSSSMPTIGAEEWSQALPRYRPLLAGDVGPGSTTVFPLAPAGPDGGPAGPDGGEEGSDAGLGEQDSGALDLGSRVDLSAEAGDSGGSGCSCNLLAGGVPGPTARLLWPLALFVLGAMARPRRRG